MACKPPHESPELVSLRAAGLRVTASRIAVLATVREGGHLTAADIADTARRRLGSVSTQAIYDVLHALTDSGLVRCIEPAGGPARFEGRVGDNHHHFVCRSCGALSDVDCAVGYAPCLQPPRLAGQDIEEAEVIYRGLCVACSAEPTEPPTREGHR